MFFFTNIDVDDPCIVNTDCQGENLVCNGKANKCESTVNIGTQTDEVVISKTGAIKKRTAFAKQLSTTIHNDGVVSRALCELSIYFVFNF